MGATHSYRIVVRATGDETIAGVAPNTSWRAGDRVVLSPTKRYVIVKIGAGRRDGRGEAAC
jgi:hypothetical protein